MPYSNMPKSKWPAMERCVADVKADGEVDNPYAVCFTSIMGKKLHKRKKKAKK